MRPGKAGNSKLPASFSMSCSPRFCSKATSGTWRAARICSRVQRGDGLGEQGGVIVFPPMRLNEDVIDLLEIDDAGLVAHRFNEGAQAQVVGVRKGLAEQAQFAQAIGGHEMGVVDDRHQQLAGAMDAKGFLDQEPFTAMVAALELNLKSFAEDTQGVVIG